jgi:chemotaxis protein MotA
MTRLQEVMTVLEASQASFVKLANSPCSNSSAARPEGTCNVRVIGIVLLLVMVFGGFVITGGALGPVLEAIPHEMLIIGGASAAALVPATRCTSSRRSAAAFKKVFKGPRHGKQDHIDAIALIHQADAAAAGRRAGRAREPCARSRRPRRSSSEYPKLLANKP